MSRLSKNRSTHNHFNLRRMNTLVKNPTLLRGKSASRLYNPWNRSSRNDFLDFWDGNVTAETIPSINIDEAKDSYILEMAAPGLKSEDFHIDVEGNVMTISSDADSRHSISEDGQATQGYSRKEFNYSEFSRSFTLPDQADSDNIIAKYQNGILALNIPKRTEAKKSVSHQVTVQ